MWACARVLLGRSTAGLIGHHKREVSGQMQRIPRLEEGAVRSLGEGSPVAIIKGHAPRFRSCRLSEKI